MLTNIINHQRNNKQQALITILLLILYHRYLNWRKLRKTIMRIGIILTIPSQVFNNLLAWANYTSVPTLKAINPPSQTTWTLWTPPFYKSKSQWIGIDIQLKRIALINYCLPSRKFLNCSRENKISHLMGISFLKDNIINECLAIIVIPGLINNISKMTRMP